MPANREEIAREGKELYKLLKNGKINFTESSVCTRVERGNWYFFQRTHPIYIDLRGIVHFAYDSTYTPSVVPYCMGRDEYNIHYADVANNPDYKGLNHWPRADSDVIYKFEKI